MLNILKMDGVHPIRLHIDAPGGVQAHCTGLGKAVLAALSPDELERQLDGSRLMKFTPRTTRQTMTLGIAQLVGQFRVHWSEIMAATVIASIIPAFFYLALQAYLIRGFTESAVKE